MNVVQLDNTRCNFNNLLLMIKIGILSTKKLFLFLFFFFLQIQGDAIDLHLKLWMMR